MSDDIVDRLRDRAHRVSGDSYALPKPDREAMTDAADEIEKLRALIAERLRRLDRVMALPYSDPGPIEYRFGWNLCLDRVHRIMRGGDE